MKKADITDSRLVLLNKIAANNNAIHTRNAVIELFIYLLSVFCIILKKNK